MKYSVRICGKGLQLPKNCVSSASLEIKHNLNPGYINQRFGVKQRYWASDETNSSMGANALQTALKDADLVFEDLDLLIYASVTYDHPLPATACMVQRNLGKEKSGVPCMDINSSCLSFLAALEVAGSLITTNAYRRIGIVSSEISSKSLNPNNAETFFLFGDGAAAFILEPSNESQSNINHFLFNTYSEGAYYTCVPGGGNIIHTNDPNSTPEQFYFHMDGKKVLLFTLKQLKKYLEKQSTIVGKEIDQFQYIIPHQASKMSMSFVLQEYKLRTNQFHNILDLYGNCVAASMPIALYDAIDKGKINRGDEVLLLGTAAGITIGSAVLTY